MAIMPILHAFCPFWANYYNKLCILYAIRNIFKTIYILSDMGEKQRQMETGRHRVATTDLIELIERRDNTFRPDLKRKIIEALIASEAKKKQEQIDRIKSMAPIYTDVLSYGQIISQLSWLRESVDRAYYRHDPDEIKELENELRNLDTRKESIERAGNFKEIIELNNNSIFAEFYNRFIAYVSKFPISHKYYVDTEHQKGLAFILTIKYLRKLESRINDPRLKELINRISIW